jgi:hypothetical protein
MVGTRNRKVSAIIASASLWIGTSQALAQVPPNDECANPTPIGNGIFNFDLTNATSSGLGLLCQEPGGVGGIARDVWFCYTPTCNGVLSVSTCGQTQADTKIAVYFGGCACPGPDTLNCCSDDNACPPAPNLQAEVLCDVQCGQQYLIQLGVKPGTGPGVGTFTVSCNGDPCPSTSEPCTATPGECCAGRPSFDNSTYAAFGNLVTVGTASPAALGTNVVAVFDVVNPSGGPFNTDFGAPIFADPSWNENDLGSVFGVTLDPQGNIYVAATSCYSLDLFGALGGIGDIYKIDTNTAAVSVWATLPNTGPALGNICYDCENDQFFVSNMDDGHIYRLSVSGAVLSTFDFGAPDSAANVFPPLGDRVWAVQAHAGRLYFSVWWEDAGNPSAAQANEIWSIDLDGSGDFSGAPQLEIQMPPNSGGVYSNPVSDLRFTPSGSLLAAERGMQNETEPVPHQSRLLEFECVTDPAGTGFWSLSPNSPYGVGVGNGENTAGGVDIDYATGGFVYATGDALQLGPQLVYGMQGLPWAPGSTVANSVLIDYNAQLNQFDKTFIGDVAVPCTGCMNVEVRSVLCEYEDGLTGCYTVTLNVTNNSGQVAQYILIPNANVSPNVIPLGTGLPNGQTMPIVITICNVDSMTTFCFNLVLANARLEECCADEVCVDLPSCSCYQLLQFDVSCITGNSFRLNFDMQNLSGVTVEHLFFLPPLPPDPLSGMTLTPSYIDVPTLVDGDNTGLINLVATLPFSPAPGTVICFQVALHDADLATCCYKQMCFTVPQCPIPLCFGDTNLDGVVNIDDLLNVINTWGPCPPPNPPCAGDVSPTDGDRLVNIDDMLTVINQWGPCK